MMLSRPVVDRNECISCGLCAKKCPPQTLKMVKGAPKFDYNGCIRCYCCQEFCPKGAITVAQSRFLKVVSVFEKLIRKLNITRKKRVEK
jgi:formate hydrogenlyase subunit 6/NADH:ubiquinone oxidoreductase subunit I